MSRALLRSSTKLLSTPASRIAAPSFASRSFSSTSRKMVVHNVQSKEDFAKVLKEHPAGVLVDFFAVWCGPCKAIAPKVVEWSEKYPNLHYIKVDVDEVPDVAQEYGIRAMPTFMIFKDGEKVTEFLGANPPGVLKIIEANHPESK